VDGPIELDKDERVIFAGDCTSWEGRINGDPVKIESSYRRPNEVDEGKTKSNDMLLKTSKTLWNCFQHKSSRYIHAKGCPVSVGDHVHFLSAIGKIHNVNFDPRMVVPVNMGYWKMRTMRAVHRLFK